jgi:serine/threonine-protein kinase
MKECSKCSLCFDDEAKFCPSDGTQLVETLPGGRDLDGRWRLERVVRVARQGSVYVASDLATPGREAVVKTFFATLFREPGSFDEFIETANRLRAVEHPNAARTYGAGHLEAGGGYLASEYLSGRTLKRALSDDGLFAVGRAAATAAPAADARAAAHAVGVLHRDVTPDRVQLETVTGRETPKLVDFEVARWAEGAGGSAVTATGSLVIRMPHYTSPEQCRGDRVDARSDIYGLGIVLYEMLTGHPPFDAASPIAVIVKHVNEPPEPPSDVRPEVSPELERVVLRALAKSAAERFQTAAEMAGALRAAADCGPAALAPPARSEAQASFVAPAPPPASAEEQRRIPAPPEPLKMRMMIIDADDENHSSRGIDGLVRDVGENGMRIQTGTVQTGQLNVIRDHTTAFKNRLEIDVFLPDGPVHVSGFAAWYKPAPDGVNWNVGVYIRDMTSADRARYNAYIQSLVTN